MKKTIQKSMSLLLTLCMVATMVAPMAALAEGAGDPVGAPPSQSDTVPMVDIIMPGNDAGEDTDAPKSEDAPAELPEVEQEETREVTVPEGPCIVDDGAPAVIYTNGASGSDKADGKWSPWPEVGTSDIHFFTMPETAQDGETYPSLSLTFKGSGIAIYGEMAKNGPVMSAAIDDLPLEDVDFYAGKATGKVYEKNGLSDSEHTLVLTFTREYSGTQEDLNAVTKIQAAIDRFEIAGVAVAQTITVNGGTADPKTAFPGAPVTVTANPADAGMEFRDWTSPDGIVFDNAAMSPATFTMPNKPVTVTAGYKYAGSEEIPREKMTATAGSEELGESDISKEGPASLVLDGNPNTLWSTAWPGTDPENQWITLDLGGLYRVDGLGCLPRSAANGKITGYEVLVSTNGTDFTKVKSGEWTTDVSWKEAPFDAPMLATHVKLKATSTIGDTANKWAAAAELRVTGAPVAPISQTKGEAGNVKLSFDATQFPDAGYRYYYSDGKTAAEAPALGEERDAAVYKTALTNGIELSRAKREYVNVVLADGDDKVVTFQSIEVTLGEPQEYRVTVVGGTVTGGGQDAEWLPEGGTATITAPETIGVATFDHWSSEDGVAFEDVNSAATTFPMLAKSVKVRANYVYPAGTAFYVDSENGADTNTGLAAGAPWKTLEKINSITLQPGDKVLLKAGSVFEGQSLSLRGKGSKTEPILVDMYDGTDIGTEAGEKPIINANGIAKADFTVGAESSPETITARPGVAYGVHIKNVSHIQVNNLEITNNSGTRQMAVGIVVEAASGNGVTEDIHLNGLYVHDVFGTTHEKTAPNGGIYMITTPGSVGTGHETRYNDISVTNCSVVDVSRTGISVGSSHSAYYWEQFKDAGGIISKEVKEKYGHTNVVIRNNYVERAGGDAIVPQFCIKPLIEYNVSNAASQNTKDDWGAMANAAIWPWRCEEALFQFNEAYATENNTDGQAYDCDSSRGTTYQYNYSHDNEGGFILLCQSQSVQSTVRYNISQNDMDSLFLVSNTEPANIYNNTFYIGAGLSKIVDLGSPANLRNNIFYNTGTNKTPSWGNFTYTNNLFYGFDNAPTGNGNITTDPLFADPGKGGDGAEDNSAIDTLTGYELLAGSPAIGAGVVIENNGGKDYAGKPVSATEKPNLGAFEGVSTQIAPEKVELDQESLALVSNGSPNTATLVATVTPENATNKAVTWQSSDEAVATVDKNGVVTAKASGIATITVTTDNRGLTDTCIVTVTTYYPPATPPGTTTTEKNEDGSTTKTVTDKKTGTVTATTKHPDGKVEKVITKKDGAVDKTVTEADGKEIKSVTTAEGAKTVAVTNKDGGKVAEISIPAVIPAPETPFADVAENSWAKSAIDTVTGLGLFTGTGEGTFSGELPMSRGMLTSVLHRLSGKIPGGEVSFDDVAEGAWYADSTAWAAGNGIVSGVGDSTFAPEKDLTRESIAAMLYRYAGLLGMDTKADGEALSGHADKDSISSWAGDAMAWAVKSGIIVGKSGALAPTDTASRAEVAVMLERFIKLL